ncbi:MAG: hypothetical protein WD557_14915 [Dehalococcoidia bacterium]
MYDPTPFTLIPRITEPDAEARFREELARGSDSVAAESEPVTVPADVEGMIARHFRRAAGFISFS